MQNIKTIPYRWAFMILSILAISCNQKTSNTDKITDMILYNAYVYPVSGDPIPEGAIVIHEGKIITVGISEDIMKEWGAQAIDKKDCEGAFVMPGFIEGHGHFMGMGYNLINLDLLDTKSWQEIVDSVASKVSQAAPGEWIIGRGWHQEKWMTPTLNDVNGYPIHDALSRISPNNPVLLRHASGHASFGNEAAMRAANITKETPDPPGGHIVRNHNGEAIGVFEERAMAPLGEAYQHYSSTLNEKELNDKWNLAVAKGQEHCLQYGITSFQDAGLSYEDIAHLNRLAIHDSLDIRLWVMLRHPYEELKEKGLDGFPILRSGQDMFTCRAIKSEVDGALGSYGAWLLAPYSDLPGKSGQNTTSIYDVKGIADLAVAHDMQLCVHAIGDKANRLVLDIYQGVLSQQTDGYLRRWRIEHAQHLNPIDIPRFKEMGVIASMQGIHCTSDAPFVVKRLGEERAKTGAYAWRSLLDQGVIIANGTDVPVERIDPFANFYASVTRKRLDNGMVFFNEQAMTRAEAIYSYTLGNAYAGFEEDIKGSLEPGKWADIVVLSNNLMTCDEDSIPVTKALMTLVGGKVLYTLK